jgi:O-antigen ligase
MTLFTQAISHILGLGYLLIALASFYSLRDQYTPAKWIALYFCGALLTGVLILNRENIRLPKPVPFKATLLGFLFFACLSVGLNPHASYRKEILDWVVLIVIALSTYQIAHESFLKILNIYNYLASALVCGYGLLQIVGYEPLPSLAHGAFPSSTFGYQTHTAEFIGISILIQLTNLSHVRKKLLAELWLGICFSYLYFLYTRSALVALLPPLVLFIRSREHCFALLRVSLWTCVLTFLFSTLSKPGTIHWFDTGMMKTKENNVSIRLARWGNTVNLIKDNPLGIGPGRFEFNYLPYHASYLKDGESNEAFVIKNPHNGYLHLIAEYGLGAGICFFLLLISVFLSLFRGLKRHYDPLTQLCLFLALFIAIDGVFAFPLSLAFPYFVASCVVGMIFQFRSSHSTPALRPTGVGLYVCFFMLCYLGFSFSFSKFYETGSSQNLSLACRVWPQNWKACLGFADAQARSGDDKSAEAILKKVLIFQENNFPAIIRLAHIERKLGNPHRAEKMLKRYRELLDGSKAQSP